MSNGIRWFVVLFLAVTVITGCDSDSGSSEAEFESFVFSNDTGQNIQVYRDGGPEWRGEENFGLTQRGAERTVELTPKGQIKFGSTVIGFGDVKTEIIENTIIFRSG